MQDSGHILFDNLGCGTKRRQMLDEQIKTGERSFRDVSEEMWGSLRVPFEDGFEVMEKELEIDPGFQEFHEFCIANGIDFNVISAGLKPILRRVLETFLGEQTVSCTRHRHEARLLNLRLVKVICQVIHPLQESRPTFLFEVWRGGLYEVTMRSE